MDFRFKLGDTVCLKVGVADAMLKCRMGLLAVPKHLCIIGRVSSECHGGIQTEYLCSDGVHGGSVRVNDNELCLSADFDFDESINSYLAIRKKTRAQDVAQDRENL